MQSKTNNTDTELRDHDLDEELAGILTAISIVCKRLAKKLLAIQQRDEPIEEGGKAYEQDE